MISEVSLSCPYCGTALVSKGREIYCPSCSKKWPIRNGIPWFSETSPYWGEIDQPSMQELNRLAREKGWKQAVNQKAPQINAYVENSNRADWSILLPMQPDWITLDIGAGLGGISFPLSKRVKQVVALESGYERAEFIDIRRQEETRENLQVVAASVHAMPLPISSFNLVVMNGILEWVPISADGDPRSIQKEILRRAHSLLVDDGWIYIGIENRTGITAFLGAQDHSGLPFTSILPRRLADFWVRRMHAKHYRTYNVMKSYRTYTYTFWGYKQLLEECGFHDFQAWGTFNYNEPTALFELNDLRGFKLYLQGFSPVSISKRFFRWLAVHFLSAFLLKLLSPCFCIIARKG